MAASTLAATGIPKSGVPEKGPSLSLLPSGLRKASRESKLRVLKDEQEFGVGGKCQHEGVSIEGQNEAQTAKYILGEGMGMQEESHLP